MGLRCHLAMRRVDRFAGPVGWPMEFQTFVMWKGNILMHGIRVQFESQVLREKAYLYECP